ncbi:hypothetical protein M9Y10_012398 [Tritrichomonas musculus]|uniref:Uncharacterized protein n=1 Tax=Tritrichomonas musculus TaxID=1915356 RepID=A0ABR2ICD7_9EUKA
MSVKPYNSYKFNKPMFKSEYSNITKSVTFIEINDPLITNQEIVIPICEPTDIQGVRKFKNTTIQLYSEFTVSSDDSEESSCLFPIPYFLIAAEHYPNDQDEEDKKIYVLQDNEDCFISTDYNDLHSLSTEILNKGTLLLQGQLLSKQALIQSTRLSKNLEASECVYLILKIPDDPVFPYFHCKGLFGTVNYSVKYS